MDDPSSTQSAGDYTDGDDPVVPPTHILPHKHQHNPHQGTHDEDVRRDVSSASEQPHKPWFWERWIRREAIGWDRAIELLFAGVIVLFSLLQYLSSRATSNQIQTIVDAANQIKSAAWTFSGAAQGINNAGWSAVGNLNMQAQATSNVAGAAQKQADRTKTIADATLEDAEEIKKTDKAFVFVRDVEIVITQLRERYSRFL